MATTKQDATLDAVLTEKQRQAQEVEISVAMAQEQAAKRFLTEETGIDLEENAPEPVRVSVRDYKIVDLLDDEGNPIPDDETGKPLKRIAYYNRTAVIETFTPTEMYMKVILLQDKLKQVNRDDKTAYIRFYAQQVLEVWKLSEPHMTEERLLKILGFPKIQELFRLFFGNLLRGFLKD